MFVSRPGVHLWTKFSAFNPDLRAYMADIGLLEA
jgi:hypothetical protein